MFSIAIPKKMHPNLRAGDIISDPVDKSITYSVFPTEGVSDSNVQMVNLVVKNNPQGASQDTLKTRFGIFITHFLEQLAAGLIDVLLHPASVPASASLPASVPNSIKKEDKKESSSASGFNPASMEKKVEDKTEKKAEDKKV